MAKESHCNLPCLAHIVHTPWLQATTGIRSSRLFFSYRKIVQVYFITKIAQAEHRESSLSMLRCGLSSAKIVQAEDRESLLSLLRRSQSSTKIAKIIDRWVVHANFYSLHAWRRKSCELKNATPMCYNRGGMSRLWSSQTIVYTMQRSAYCITLWWSKTMAPGPTPVGNVLSNTPDSS